MPRMEMSFERRFRGVVPAPVKEAARPIVRWSGVAGDRLRGRPLPPWSLRRQVPGDFRAVGGVFLGHLVELGGLRTDDRVLDIGCRAGRVAIPLTGYLAPGSRYEGVDDWEEGTAWCQRHLTSRAPNFRFKTIGMGVPEPLPYEPGSFDFVILASILHLSRPTFDYYLAEAARVLRPGGTYFGTWFLTATGTHPAMSLACTESEARARLEELGLGAEAIYRGSWDGHRPSLSYQDVVIGHKHST